MKKILILIIIALLILTACKQESKSEIIVYGDYKCPYCKKVEKEIMPEIKKEYIDKNKAEFKFVNMAFLGKDSIKGSRSGHAVQNIAPDKYLDFQNYVFSEQPNNEDEWITDELLDKQIDKLNINEDKKRKIKKDYKTENSQSWKDAKDDKKRAKDNKIKVAPSIYINEEKVENPYDVNEYKQKLKDK